MDFSGVIAEEEVIKDLKIQKKQQHPHQY